MRMYGMPEGLRFPDDFTEEQKVKLIGLGMDGHCIRALGDAVRTYIHGTHKPTPTMVCSSIADTSNAHEVATAVAAASSATAPSDMPQAWPVRTKAQAERHTDRRPEVSHSATAARSMLQGQTPSVRHIPKANDRKSVPTKTEIITALRHTLSEQNNNTRGCRQGSRYDVHCNCGHPNVHQSKILGIAPYPDCELCTRFCGVRHSRSTELVPKPTKALKLVQIDLKVCNTKSRRGNKYIVGIIDMFTGRSWTIPSPSNSAADVIRIITHWRVQTVNNKPIGMIMTDNASWAVSDEWTNAVDNMQTPQRKCGAYENHQNGGAEGLFRRANPLCGLYLASSAQFGDEYWGYAYVHANAHLQYFAPTKDSLTPMQRWQHAYPSERIHTDSSFLRAWGSKCFSYNETRSGFDPRKNVGYLLGYPEQHSRDLYTVHNVHTNRVKEAVACTFSAPSSDDQASDAKVSVEFVSAASVGPPSKLATNATRQRANAKQGQGDSFPPDGIVRLNRTERDRARDTSVKMRRVLVDNLAVRDAVHNCASQS
jgi:hypothetical protein